MELKKGTCKNCGEERILNKKDLCIFCTTIYHGPATEIKETKINRGGGVEIKSKTGSTKKGYADNSWMSKKS